MNKKNKMKTRIFLMSFIIFNLFLNHSFAQDIYSFQSKAEENSFYKLINESRCVVCQNQNLADSNSIIAKDLRNKIYDLIKQGKKEEEVKTFLINRYGDFILFKPPVTISTYILWFGPYILLILGFIVLIYFIKRSRSSK
jgi:cytochrome c-type biogenesis protein CcmH